MSQKVQTINPATEEVLNEYEFNSAPEIEAALAESHEAYGHWRRLKLESRLACVEDFATALTSARVTLADWMTREMGKTLKESLSEVDKCAASCRTLVELYPKWLAERNGDLGNGFHITHEPLGVVLGIMPWNFPLWQVVRFAIPAILGGNTILLKHAPNTWGSAEFIEGLFRQAFPHQTYINLRMDVDKVGGVLADRRVAGVSLTGSRRAGVRVGELAGKNLKKCVLELGGSDAYVVLDDADLELAAKTCVTSRLINGGQSCVSAKRFIVTKRNAGEFTERMRALMQIKVMGDPTDNRSDFGPLARKDLREGLHAQVEKSVKAGAQLLLGGSIPKQKGFYYPPSVLVGVKPGQAAFDEELFGPVASIIEAADENEAIYFANHSIYGLGAAVFSRDEERACTIAREEIEAGMVCVNDFVKSDATAPFGGIKDSGLGRELGREGSFEFTNVKSVFKKRRCNK